MLTYTEAKQCINELDRSGLEDLIESLGAEVIKAALYLGIDPGNIEEAYSGQYSSDVEFAQDMAEQLGSVDKNASWPNTCIDWEYAAKELMYDYSEHDGYYFRQL